MVFKINISENGKAWKVQMESEFLVGKSIGDKVDGKEIKPELVGYELEITGGSDSAGFPLSKDVPGLALKSQLLTRGFAMRDNTEGMRRKKTVRGKTISAVVSLINMRVVKAGAKSLKEIFPEQNQPKEKKAVAPAPVA